MQKVKLLAESIDNKGFKGESSLTKLKISNKDRQKRQIWAGISLLNSGIL